MVTFPMTYAPGATKTSRPSVGVTPSKERSSPIVSGFRGNEGQGATARGFRGRRLAKRLRARRDLPFERMLERTHDLHFDDLSDERRAVLVRDVHDLVALGSAGHLVRTGFALPLNEHALRRADQRRELRLLQRFGEREERPEPRRFGRL